MKRNEAMIHYHAAMLIFRKWLAEHIISNEEYVMLEALVSDKYGLSIGSIYRESPC